ncbi:MAG: hypothetical protein CME70_12875 [Halobacteriovorax sp.]|nr:hypothetical protein [Halobacteriovorax sp.]|tara:strand:- start:160014 stop:161477 length:1464 start_codon:yes stop_codon:yes gene_type:complete
MKALFISLFIFSTPVFASADLSKAPFEWLVAQTLMEKLDHENHVHEDKLTKEIFETINYDEESDSLILSSSRKTNALRKKLVEHVSKLAERRDSDPLYQQWKKEGRSKINVRTRKSTSTDSGYYFFNHIHTEISQDNSSLKFLKISPEKTINLVKGFLEKRNAKGVASLTDHDTDRGFEDVKDMADDNLGIVRGIEWGGSTHMCLIDIKKDWDLLSKGREYKYEESIIKSRSSEGFRIANHPSKKDGFPYTRWLDVDGVEVWNMIMEDAAFRKLPLKKANNRKALDQWVQSLAAGKRHTAMAGGDFHFIIPCLKDRSLHYPANYIPTNDGTPLKDILKEGRTSITTMPTAPNLRLRASFEDSNEWAEMGQDLKGEGELKILLTADFSHTKTLMRSACYNIIAGFTKLLTFWKKRRWELRFYNMNGELIAKESIKPRKFGAKKSFISGFKWPVAKGKAELIRAELWSINKKTESIDLLAMTNPIYINR